jgi:arylsulfatase
MATNLDLLPTVAALCGAKLPAKKIDGMDMSSLLLQKTTISPRDLFYYYYNENSLRAVRYKNWKLVLPHTTVSYEQATPGKDGAKGEWKTVKVEEALYDLFSDPGERMDVKAQYPEQVKALYQWVEEARKDLGDELTGRPGANRRAPAYIKLSQ